MVHRMDTLLDEGYELPRWREWIVRENKWRAARHGLEAEVIVDETGRTEPLRESLSELIDQLGPVSRRLGCEAELARVATMMERGPSYLRQREVVAAGGSLVDVVDTLLEELETNEFTRRREPVDGPVPGPLPPSVTPPIASGSRAGE
jgi:carboxylate-amine ligase